MVDVDLKTQKRIVVFTTLVLLISSVGQVHAEDNLRVYYAGSDGSVKTALGARLSPLNNRFPISIRPAAMEEARSLTLEKVRL